MLPVTRPADAGLTAIVVKACVTATETLLVAVSPQASAIVTVKV